MVVYGRFFINVIFFNHVEHSALAGRVDDVHGFRNWTERVVRF
jgi:hypothetical protein